MLFGSNLHPTLQLYSPHFLKWFPILPYFGYLHWPWFIALTELLSSEASLLMHREVTSSAGSMTWTYQTLFFDRTSWNLLVVTILFWFYLIECWYLFSLQVKLFEWSAMAYFSPNQWPLAIFSLFQFVMIFLSNQKVP